MILAAGLGTRLRPLTNEKPKTLVEINGVPILELIILKLKKEGITDILINIHHFPEKVKDFLLSKNYFDINISFSDETEKLLDTGGAIKKAKDFFYGEKAFIVYNTDVISNISLSDLIEKHLQNDSLATLAVTERETSRPLVFDENKLLCLWKNNKTGEELKVRKPQGNIKEFGFSCVHVISTKIFDLMPEEDIFSITRLYLQLANKYKISCYNHSEGIWAEIGNLNRLKAIEENKEIIYYIKTLKNN